MKKYKLTVLALLNIVAFPSIASTYPNKPVTLVVAYAPGGMTDILTRRVAEQLQKKLGQPFIVENRAGATGQIATEYVSRQKPDGYTILVGATSHVINPAFKTLPYDAKKDFSPIALLAVSPNFLLVNSKLNINTFDEFKAYAADKKSVAYGTAGAGGAPHIVGQLLKEQSGIPLEHISYRGAGPAMTDLISGQVPVGLAESVTAKVHLDSGAIVPLAVASAERVPLYKDVPTLNELGYRDFDLNTWVGAYAPAGTPKEVLVVLNEAISEAIQSESITGYIESTGSEPGKMDLGQYEAFVENEMEKWDYVIKYAKVQLD